MIKIYPNRNGSETWRNVLCSILLSLKFFVTFVRHGQLQRGSEKDSILGGRVILIKRTLIDKCRPKLNYLYVYEREILNVSIRIINQKVFSSNW